MNDPTTILLGEIEALDDASVAEAAQLLSATLGADASSDILDPDFKDRPMEHRADIVDLSRLLLMAAATDPHTAARVGVDRRSRPQESGPRRHGARGHCWPSGQCPPNLPLEGKDQQGRRDHDRTA
jgi:hypothetical protein